MVVFSVASKMPLVLLTYNFNTILQGRCYFHNKLHLLKFVIFVFLIFLVLSTKIFFTALKERNESTYVVVFFFSFTVSLYNSGVIHVNHTFKDYNYYTIYNSNKF